MSAVEDPGAELTPAELRDLRRLAGFLVPASAEYSVPGADDEAIFADIVRSLGRDKDAIREAVAMLREIAVGDWPAARAAWRVIGDGSPGHRKRAPISLKFGTLRDGCRPA